MPAQFPASKRKDARSKTSASASGQSGRPAPLVRITSRCSSEREYIEQYAADVCARGIYLRTRAPMPIGTRVRFEVLLRGGRCAIGGVGRVVWSREAKQDPSGRAGFGIAFDRLRRGDRAFIERMTALRGNEPSRFEQPDISPSDPPQGVGLANALFDDVTLAAESADDPNTAFLSADLSEELGQGPFRFASMRVSKRSESERAVELAEQLEPRAETADDDEKNSGQVLDHLAHSKRLREALERGRPKLVSTTPAKTSAQIATLSGLSPAPRVRRNTPAARQLSRSAVAQPMPISALRTESVVTSRPRSTPSAGLAAATRPRNSTPPELRLLRSVPAPAPEPARTPAPVIERVPVPVPARGWTPAMTFLLIAVLLCASTVGYLALTGRLNALFAG